jgi:hypothetical protein
MFDLYSPYIHIDCIICKEPLLGYDATIKFIFYLDLDRSMRFEEVKGRYDSKDIETDIENFWDEINAYEKQKGKNRMKNSSSSMAPLHNGQYSSRHRVEQDN